MGLRNAQYHAIMREYEKRQLKSHDIQTARYEEVYTKLPEFKSLDDYIQKVAIAWAKDGISTVSQAKEQSAVYNRNCYTVLNAFGIKNRGPATSELAFINKWAEQYCFEADIIQEACRRTISATHQPSFEYADRILTRWYEQGVRHLQDIAALDEQYQKERSSRRAAAPRQPNTKNLNNFERRSYDMDSLEAQLLKSN